MTVKLANNATSKLAASISSSDTTIIVLPGDGAKFPTLTGGDTFPVTLVSAAGQIEICRCTARSSDTLTVTRGQENTSSKAFSAGDRIELRLTNGAYEERLGEKFDKTGGSISGPISLAGSDNVLPVYSSPPTTNKGDIHVVGVGPMTWDGTKYVSTYATDMQWLGTPIGGYITPHSPPPTNDPRFRYILCSAGETNAGKYNESVLISETVTGTAPLIEATAVVSLAGSPLDSKTVHLINTEGRFVGAGVSEAFENDSIQNITGNLGAQGGVAWQTGTGVLALSGPSSNSVASVASQVPGTTLSFDASRVARTSDHTQPRTHRLPHFRRIL